jgi:hypothetical protein
MSLTWNKSDPTFQRRKELVKNKRQYLQIKSVSRDVFASLSPPPTVYQILHQNFSQKVQKSIFMKVVSYSQVLKRVVFSLQNPSWSRFSRFVPTTTTPTAAATAAKTTSTTTTTTTTTI